MIDIDDKYEIIGEKLDTILEVTPLMMITSLCQVMKTYYIIFTSGAGKPKRR